MAQPARLTVQPSFRTYVNLLLPSARISTLLEPWPSRAFLEVASSFVQVGNAVLAVVGDVLRASVDSRRREAVIWTLSVLGARLSSP